MKLYKMLFGAHSTKKSLSEEGKRKVIEGLFGEEDKYNQFYGSASLAYRFLSFFLILSFLFCIISASFANADSFSVQNLEFILRNFALQLEANEDESVYAIKYNPDTSRNFALYKNGLAVCGNNGLSVFSATGRLTVSESINYLNPIMLSGDKYVLVYDALGHSYTVYNSFSAVYSSTLEHTIFGGAVSDNGYYALITGSDEYNSTVEVYNSDFELINRINKNGYVISVDITDSHLLVTTASVSADGQYSTEIMLFDYADSGEAIYTNQSSVLPISCSLNNDSFTVICDNTLYSYNYDCVNTGIYRFDGRVLSDFDCHAGYTLLLFKNKGFGTDHSVVCIDKASDIAFEYEIDKTVFGIDLYEDSSFVLTENSLIKINDGSYTEIDYFGGDHSTVLIACGLNDVYVCTSSSAPLMKFE